MPSTRPNQQIKPTLRQLRYLRALAQRTGTTFTPPRTISDASQMIQAMQRREQIPRREIRRERRAVSRDMATLRGDAAQVKPNEVAGHGSSATWSKAKARETGPRVVNCKHEPCDVLIDRSTKWGNPFVVGRHGTREECIAKYEEWAPQQPHLMAALHELQGQTLGCHCKPKPCHGDLLLRWANTTRPTTPAPAAQPHKGQPHALAGYRVGDEQRLIVVQRIHGAICVGDLPANGKGKRHLIANDLHTCGELHDLLLDYGSQIARLGVIPASPIAIDHMLRLAA